MPTYQYRCTDCGHELEEFQSFTDDALTVCPVCGGRLRQVFNAVGVVFKGSGFYRTDSRQSGATSTASSSDDSSTKGTSESTSSPAASSTSSSPAPAAPATSSGSSSAG